MLGASKPSIEKLSFAVLTIAATAAFLWLVAPFYSGILWAVILAILFDPLKKWLDMKTPGRPGLAAALALIFCICVVVAPGSIILGLLSHEAAITYEKISARDWDPAVLLDQAKSVAPPFASDLLSALHLGDLRSALTSYLGSFTHGVASGALIIGQGAGVFLLNLALMLYLLFFLFRDGPGLTRAIREASPLSPRHTEMLLERFIAVARATVRGSAIVALIQGLVAGGMFWAVGVEGALLWGVVMTFLSLLPAIGAALVWVPVAIYLALAGFYAKAIILSAVCAVANTAIDNLLRPPLVGKGVRLPDYMVLISTIGGLAAFGVNGLVIGPLIAALFVAVWSLFVDERAHVAN